MRHERSEEREPGPPQGAHRTKRRVQNPFHVDDRRGPPSCGMRSPRREPCAVERTVLHGHRAAPSVGLVRNVLLIAPVTQTLDVLYTLDRWSTWRCWTGPGQSRLA